MRYVPPEGPELAIADKAPACDSLDGPAEEILPVAAGADDGAAAGADEGANKDPAPPELRILSTWLWESMPRLGTLLLVVAGPLPMPTLDRPLSIALAAAPLMFGPTFKDESEVFARLGSPVVLKTIAVSRGSVFVSLAM